MSRDRAMPCNENEGRLSRDSRRRRPIYRFPAGDTLAATPSGCRTLARLGRPGTLRFGRKWPGGLYWANTDRTLAAITKRNIGDR